MFLLLLALFVFPIALYCTIIGMINRRTRPLLVSGTWDFLGVLLATSGFLLFLGPALLSGMFRESISEVPFQRGTSGLAGAISSLWASWWVAWLLYYLAVLGGAAYLVWWRRNTTVIYNVDPHTLETVLTRLIERLSLKASRLGNRWFLGINTAPVPLTTPGDAPTHFTANPAPAGAAWAPLGELAVDAGVSASAPRSNRLVGEQVIVDVEAFEMLSNASLHWRSASPEARASLERELRQALAEVYAPESPVSTWLLGIATLLFLIILMLTTVFVMVVIKRAG